MFYVELLRPSATQWQLLHVEWQFSNVYGAKFLFSCFFIFLLLFYNSLRVESKSEITFSVF